MSVSDDLCRVCGDQFIDLETVHIFAAENSHVLSTIKLNFPNTTDEDDLLSKSICMQCLKILNDVFELRAKNQVAVGIFKKTLLWVESWDDEVLETDGIDDLCRLCAFDLYTGNRNDLFSLGNSDILSIIKLNNLIMQFDNENYPRNICNHCFAKLISLRELRKKNLAAINIFEKTFPAIKTENCSQDYSDTTVLLKEEILSDPEVCEDAETKYAKNGNENRLADSLASRHCSQIFKQEENLNLHIDKCKQVSESNLPFRCKKCGKSFARKDVLTAHTQTHNVEKCFQCAECGQNFITKRKLTRHVGIHSGEKPFQCIECGLNVRTIEQLTAHKRAHLGKKPFQCSECGKKFPSKSDLTRHERKHSGEKPFQCLECGKCFSDKSNFTRHERKHSGEKPFPCSTCKKRFSHKFHLTIHLRRHSGDRPFPCTDCGKSFITKTDLKNHSRLHRPTNRK